MKFDLTNKSTEELLERQELLAVEIPQETRDAMTEDEIEERADELAAIKAELDARKAAAAEIEQKAEEVALKQGEPIIESEDRKMYDINTAEYRDLWIRNLQGNLNEEEKRAYTSGNTNAVPTLVSDKFFEKMKKLAPMLSEITLLRVAGSIKFVAEGTRNSADSKHTENSANSPAADTTVSVTLGGFEFLKIIQISRTAKLMSIDAFEGWLVNMLAGDIARAIDDYIINDASNGIAAITWTSNTNQIVEATPGYGDICDLIALLPAAYDAEAKFLVNKKTLYTKIAQIVDSTGNPIFVPDTVSGVGGRLMGYPVVVDDYVVSSNGSLYLGRWTDVVGNLSEDIHVDADESAGFTANSIMYRGVAVFDSKPAKTDAIVRLVTTTA
jgi:HK97 family phage major capsid protein